MKNQYVFKVSRMGLLAGSFIGALSAIGCVNQASRDTSKALVENGRDPATARGDKAIEDHKWVARIQMKNVVCTAFLITEDVLMTAAHCLIRDQAKPRGALRDTSEILVTFGFGTSEMAIYDVKEIGVHPEFDSDPYLFSTKKDLGLVKLNRKVANKYAANLPVLTFEPEALRNLGIPGGAFTFFGYGFTNGNVSPKTLLFGQAYAKGYIECINKIFRQNAVGHKLNQGDEFFCSVGSDRSMRTSGGDSGGPAVVFKDEKQHVIGVVHGGTNKTCTDNSNVDLFSTLLNPATKPWIESFTK